MLDRTINRKSDLPGGAFLPFLPQAKTIAKILNKNKILTRKFMTVNPVKVEAKYQEIECVISFIYIEFRTCVHSNETDTLVCFMTCA